MPTERSKTPALWTPLYEPAITKYSLIGAAVYGEVWRYCQMGKQMCVASRETIAGNLGLAIRTVDKYLELLSSGDEPYIKDLTPDVRNRPHAYIDTGQCRIDSEAMQELHTTASQGAQDVHSGVQEMPTVEDEILPSGVQDVHSTVQDLHPGVQTSAVRCANSALEESIKRDNEETSQERSPIPITPPPAVARPPSLTGDDIQHMRANPTPELRDRWPIFNQTYQASRGDSEWGRWIKPLVPLCLEDSTVLLGAPDIYIEEWCRERLKKPICEYLYGALGYHVNVVFTVLPQPGGT